MTPSWLVLAARLTFKRHLPGTKTDVLLTFCTYKVQYPKKKKPAVKTAGVTSQDGILMVTMRCARRHARGHQLQRCWERVGLREGLRPTGVSKFCLQIRIHKCLWYFHFFLIYCIFPYTSVSLRLLLNRIHWRSKSFIVALYNKLPLFRRTKHFILYC